ncbi:MAG: hydroxymethylglutaryl-CoA lyase [Ilumatobacteraceae bacterium]|nr:hydroxymethylglutaryl-CoA lyase [Ilumatobacteraceae bacterium]
MIDVLIRDCGPRDGLQGEEPQSVEVRRRLAHSLAEAGLRHVEAVSFVSPKAVPSMADAAEVLADLDDVATWWALVPNRRGAELAVAAGATHITVTVSASESYSQKNVGMTVRESIAQIIQIRSAAPVAELDVVVSCAFGSAQDVVRPEDVAGVRAAVIQAGADRVTLADTTGVATPERIERVLDQSGVDVGIHLHDTRGFALTNAYCAYRIGVRRFDTAVGGLGGSPFAVGAGGNLATEDLVLLLEDAGITTGVDLDRLLDVSRWLASVLGKDMPSRVTRAGRLPGHP